MRVIHSLTRALPCGPTDSKTLLALPSRLLTPKASHPFFSLCCSSNPLLPASLPPPPLPSPTPNRQAWRRFNGHHPGRDFTQGHLHIYSFVLGFIPDDLPLFLPPSVSPAVSTLPPRVEGGGGGGEEGGAPPASSVGSPEGTETAGVDPSILLCTTGEGFAGQEDTGGGLAGQEDQEERKVKRPRTGGGKEGVGGGGEGDQLMCSFPASSPSSPSFVLPLLPPTPSSPPGIMPLPMVVLRASMKGATPDPEPSHIQQQQQQQQQQSILLLDIPVAGRKADECNGGGGRRRDIRREGGWHEIPFDLPTPEANAVVARCGLFWSMPIPEEGGREGGREGGCPPCWPEVICDESFARMFLTEEAIRREMMEKGRGIEAIWEW